MRLRKGWAMLVAAALGAGALTACQPATAPADTLVVADGNSALDTLLPANTALAFSELGVLFAPLVAFAEDGSLRYVQAKSVTGSDDSRTWTISLRPGWTFHNGEPLTAQSYADGWNATAYKPNGYLNSLQLANVAGYADLNPAKGAPKARTMSGLTVLDRYTLRVRLTAPDSQFPLKLTSGQTGFYPMPKAGLRDPDSFKTDPIGTGPYEMDGAAALNQRVDVKRWDGYRGANRGHSPRISFRMYTSPATAYTDTLAGNVDISLAPQEKFPQIEQDFGDHVTISSGASVEYLGFPLFDKRFRDVRLRRAISLALDRTAIDRAIFGGYYKPADSLLAPTTVGGSPKSCAYCRFDPAEAKRLLAAAGGWSGRMTLTYPGGAGYDQTFQAIANLLRLNLGIDAVAQPTIGFSDFLADLGEQKFRDGPWRGKWGSVFPSASDTLRQVFTADGSFNFTTGGYRSAQVAKLVAAGDAATGQRDAVAEYHAAERTIEQDFPVVPLFFETFPFVHSDRVTNVRARPFQIDTDFEAVRLR